MRQDADGILAAKDALILQYGKICAANLEGAMSSLTTPEVL